MHQEATPIYNQPSSGSNCFTMNPLRTTICYRFQQSGGTGLGVRGSLVRIQSSRPISQKTYRSHFRVLGSRFVFRFGLKCEARCSVCDRLSIMEGRAMMPRRAPALIVTLCSSRWISERIPWARSAGVRGSRRAREPWSAFRWLGSGERLHLLYECDPSFAANYQKK